MSITGIGLLAVATHNGAWSVQTQQRRTDASNRIMGGVTLTTDKDTADEVAVIAEFAYALLHLFRDRACVIVLDCTGLLIAVHDLCAGRAEVQ